MRDTEEIGVRGVDREKGPALVALVVWSSNLILLNWIHDDGTYPALFAIERSDSDRNSRNGSSLTTGDATWVSVLKTSKDAFPSQIMAREAQNDSERFG